jgi:hypothetical protein
MMGRLETCSLVISITVSLQVPLRWGRSSGSKTTHRGRRGARSWGVGVRIDGRARASGWGSRGLVVYRGRLRRQVCGASSAPPPRSVTGATGLARPPPQSAAWAVCLGAAPCGAGGGGERWGVRDCTRRGVARRAHVAPKDAAPPPAPHTSRQCTQLTRRFGEGVARPPSLQEESVGEAQTTPHKPAASTSLDTPPTPAITTRPVPQQMSWMISSGRPLLHRAPWWRHETPRCAWRRDASIPSRLRPPRRVDSRPDTHQRPETPLCAPPRDAPIPTPTLTFYQTAARRCPR